MHTKRVIPCLDIKDGRVVKGVNFVNHMWNFKPSPGRNPQDLTFQNMKPLHAGTLLTAVKQQLQSQAGQGGFVDNQ